MSEQTVFIDPEPEKPFNVKQRIEELERQVKELKKQMEFLNSIFGPEHWIEKPQEKGPIIRPLMSERGRDE